MQPKMIRHNGIELSQSGWAEYVGLTRQGLGKRLRSMPLAEALAKTREERERLWRRNLLRAKAQAAAE